MPSPVHFRNLMQQRKQLILNFVHLYRLEHEGVCPGVRQIAYGIGYGPKTYGTVSNMVRELIYEGWLKREVPGGRTLVLTRPPDAEYCKITDDEIKVIARKQKRLAKIAE